MGCFFDSFFNIYELQKLVTRSHYNKAFTLRGINFRFFYVWKKRPMPSYRLLRSNKESGPYSLNDLVALGLKPYDLVWVDGRSAAWRYPSEISELKEYAPAVEEQPYDRFFKKPSETETPIIEPVASPNSEKTYQQPTINESFAKEESAKNIFEKPVEIKEVRKTISEIPQPYPSPEPKKKVFVSMPETNTFEPYQETYKASQYDQQYEQYLPKSKPEPVKQQPIEQRTYSPISVQESEERRLETKYSQSLDDIKEMYINTLVQRKTKNRRKEIFKKLRPALIPVLLLAAGFAIGYYFMKTRNNPLQASQSISTVVPQQTVPGEKKEATSPDNNANDTKITQPENQDLPSHQQNSVQPTDKNSVQPTDRTINNKNNKDLNGQEQVIVQSEQRNKDVESSVPKAVLTERKDKESVGPGDEESSFQKKNVEVDPTTGERKKVVRDYNSDVSSLHNDSRNTTSSSGKRSKTEPNFIETDHKDLRDLVTVQSNNYVRGAFGGIRGLELTVSNNSDFLVDEVSVELQIMKPSEQPLRTDIITFKNIGSNKSITVKVPDSQRGIRVDYHITNIESKQWEKGTAGL
jgi:hypothetical protein